ncbi:hypothetical protein FS837_006109 [Tulasnella sp. UAMH 9824]|nr:hypothetical protein FS837_006109 [Tulasnella sp. UAMH 9824]
MSDLAKLREAVSKMKLVRLELPQICDPDVLRGATMGLFPRNSDSEDDRDGDQNIQNGGLSEQNIWNEDLGDQIQKMLQAQPLLEEFELGDLISRTTIKSLQDRLQALDVPNLKSLRADTYIALPFLRVTPRLESLNLAMAVWSGELLSEMETSSVATKLSISRFTIRVWSSNEWLWNNLTKVFSLFPRTEELSVSINCLTSNKPVKHASYFFKKIGDRIGVLPSLRHIDVIFETCHPKTPGIRKVEMESIRDFKIACPLLETVVDPERRLWTFRPDRQILAGLAAHLVGPLMREPLGPGKDLPAPEAASTTGARREMMHLRSRPIRKK